MQQNITHKAKLELDDNTDNSIYTEQSFDLIDLFDLLFAKKLVILLFSFTFLFAGVIYVMFATPYYRSSIVFTSPTDNLNPNGTYAGDILGGVGSVLGVSGKTSPETAYNLSVLESRDFLTQFFAKHGLMPHLLSKYWNATNESWLPINRSFLGKISDFLLGEEPQYISEDEVKRAELAYEKFKKLTSINIDKETDIITLRIEWVNPVLASKWANELLAMLNETMRNRAIRKSEERINYLQAEINKTQISNMENLLFNMMENEMKNAMLANVQKDYSFTIIDAANPAVRPYKPRKIVILILSLISGFLIGALYVMCQKYIMTLKEAKINSHNCTT